MQPQSEVKFPVKTDTWTIEIENVVKQIGESCLGYKWMNIFAAKKNEMFYNILMYISIVLGPVSGILSTVSLEQDKSILDTFIIVLSFLSGVLISIIKFSDFNQKSILYKSTASKYSSLENNIRRQLSLNRLERVNSGEYLEWVSNSFDELFDSSPLISEDIYQEWVKIAKENSIFIPQKLNTIVVDNTKEKVEQLSTLAQVDVNSNAHTEEHKELKKQRTFENCVDISKYSDGKMKYEMRRLFGM